jgi:NDP-sugar pyrophosphorylase family protein
VRDERCFSRLPGLVKAVVFAGGEGARLLPYTSVLPKPLLPVGDRPVLEIIVAQLREAGITEIVLATGYLSSLIETYFGDGSNWGVNITYNREKTQLGTVGALADLPGLDETFIMMNGDVLATPLYRELVQAHRDAGAAATIATKLQAVDVDYGVLRLGEPVGALRAIEGIDEKPRYAWPVSMGIYAVEPSVVRLIEPGRRMDLPQLIERLIEEGETVAAYDHAGYWQDIGRLHDLETAVQAFEGSADEFVGSAGLGLPDGGAVGGADTPGHQPAAGPTPPHPRRAPNA